MKLSKQNRKRLQKQLKSLKVKGDWYDEDQLTDLLLYILKREDSPQHNHVVAITKGIIGLDEAVPAARHTTTTKTLENFLA